MTEVDMADLLDLDDDDGVDAELMLLEIGRPSAVSAVSRVCLLCGDRGPSRSCPRCHASWRPIEATA